MRSVLSIVLIATVCCPALATPPASGLRTGDSVEPWNPIHVAGPDRGTTHCPVCTYLHRPAVVVFTKDSAELASLAARVEQLVATHARHELKGFVAVLDARPERAAEIARAAQVVRSAVCVLNPGTRDKELQAYQINPAAQNTILVYRDYKVVASFVNLKATDFARVESIVQNLLQ